MLLRNHLLSQLFERIILADSSDHFDRLLLEFKARLNLSEDAFELLYSEISNFSSACITRYSVESDERNQDEKICSIVLDEIGVSNPSGKDSSELLRQTIVSSFAMAFLKQVAFKNSVSKASWYPDFESNLISSLNTICSKKSVYFEQIVRLFISQRALGVSRKKDNVDCFLDGLHELFVEMASRSKEVDLETISCIVPLIPYQLGLLAGVSRYTKKEIAIRSRAILKDFERVEDCIEQYEKEIYSFVGVHSRLLGIESISSAECILEDLHIQLIGRSLEGFFPQNTLAFLKARSYEFLLDILEGATFYNQVPSLYKFLDRQNGKDEFLDSAQDRISKFSMPENIVKSGPIGSHSSGDVLEDAASYAYYCWEVMSSYLASEERKICLDFLSKLISDSEENAVLSLALSEVDDLLYQTLQTAIAKHPGKHPDLALDPEFFEEEQDAHVDIADEQLVCQDDSSCESFSSKSKSLSDKGSPVVSIAWVLSFGVLLASALSVGDKLAAWAFPQRTSAADAELAKQRPHLVAELPLQNFVAGQEVSAISSDVKEKLFSSMAYVGPAGAYEDVLYNGETGCSTVSRKIYLRKHVPTVAYSGDKLFCGQYVAVVNRTNNKVMIARVNDTRPVLSDEGGVTLSKALYQGLAVTPDDILGLLQIPSSDGIPEISSLASFLGSDFAFVDSPRSGSRVPSES